MITFRIRGVVREESGVGIEGLFVKAYDKDLLFDDLLGSAVTGERGRFEIVTEPSDFRDFFDKRPDLYFKIYRADRTTLLHSTKRGVRWNVGRLSVVEIEIPSEALFPPEEARVDLTGEDGTPQERFEPGDSLTVSARGLRPMAAYEISVRSDGEELFRSRLITNRRGELEPTVLWPQFGLDDPGSDQRLTVAGARERWQGRNLEVTIGSGKRTLLRQGVRLADVFSRPLVLSADAEGRMVNGFEQGAQGLHLSLHNLPFRGAARIYMVASQQDWREGDGFSVATLADGSPAVREIRLEDEHGDQLVEFAAAEALPVGAYDFIVRPVRYGFEDDEQTRLLPQDVVSGRRVTGVVIREGFWAAKPVLGGCVNKIPVSGRSISGAPYFQYSDTFALGENVYGALDPGLIDPGNITKMCAFYVVDSKTATQWAASNALSHIPELGGNSAVIVRKVQSGCINANKVLLWPGANRTGDFDIVADFGNNTDDPTAFTPNNAYDTPLDVIDGYFVAGFRVVRDPGTYTEPGLFDGNWNYDETTVAGMGLPGSPNVDDENTFYSTPGGFSVLTRQVRLKAHVFFPADSAGVTDPAQISTTKPSFPLVVVVHGNGHDYTDYDFLLQHLAKNGFIAASIDNRYFNGAVLVHGMHGLGRANNFFKHLEVLKTKFGGKLQDNIGVMGHSRGGEAVIKIARLNAALGNNINALMSLAPTDQYGKEVLSGAYATPLLVLYGSRDGDVAGWHPSIVTGSFTWRMTGFSLYDRASGAAKSMTFVYRATHNGFITSNSDNPADSPLPPATQKAITQAYATAFFRQHLRNEPQWNGMFTGEWKPPSVDSTGAELFTQYRATGGKTVDDFEAAPANWQSSSIGGAVSQTGLPANPSEAHMFDYPPGNPGLDTQSPHDSKGLKIRWDSSGDRLTWSIPAAHKDVSAFAAVSLRVTQKQGSASNPASQAQDFRLTLKDSSGNQRAVRVSAFGAVPFPDQRANSDLRKSAMTTVRVPLTAYTIVCAGQAQVDLTDLVELSLDFVQKPTGEIEVDEIEFTA